MARFIKKRKEDIGMAPDELLFRGEQKTDTIQLRLIDFTADDLEENVVNTVKEVLQYQEKDTVTWFNVDGLHHAGIMQEIAEGFQLDKLILAEVMNTHGRPTVQEYDNCIFLSIKMLQYNGHTEQISVEHLSLILMKSVLISFQERRGDVFEPIRERIRKKKKVRTSGTDYLLFALLDIVIDNYIYIISVIGDKIEGLEEKLLADPKENVIEQINTYKRELNFLRRNIKPTRELILALSKVESDLITGGTLIHFKELQDNINQASDSSDSYREILSDQLNIYHTTISSKLNDIMKFLTIFSVIFIPLTFIAGIYGTNFDYIPELSYQNSYFIMWGVMVIVALGMLFYFRRRNWF